MLQAYINLLYEQPTFASPYDLTLEKNLSKLFKLITYLLL